VHVAFQKYLVQLFTTRSPAYVDQYTVYLGDSVLPQSFSDSSSEHSRYIFNNRTIFFHMFSMGLRSGLQLGQSNTFIQGGNFNWNKIHNLEIGNFCKKS
jgi:hypothetical protein